MVEHDKKTNGDRRKISQSPLSRRAYLSGATASVVSAGIAGCTGGGGDDDPIQVGYVVPTSGPYALAGQNYQESLELAEERFDREVDGRQIETTVRDSGTATDVAVPTANELVRDGVDVLIGGLSSSVVLALEDIAAREEIPFFGIGGTSIETTGENCNRYSFIKLASGYQYSGAPLLMYEQERAESFYFIVADYGGGWGPYEGITAMLEEHTDAELLGNSVAPLGNDDYSSQISDARQSGADAVWCATFGSDSVTLGTQAADAGLTEEMHLGYGISGNGVADGIGHDRLQNTLAGTSFYHTIDKAQEFTEDYENKFGRPPRWTAADAFDCCMEYFSAVERAGTTDADAIVDELEGNEFDWTRGPEQWRECDHRAIQPYFLLRAKDEMEGEHDHFEVLGNKEGEEIMRACEDTGCEL